MAWDDEMMAELKAGVEAGRSYGDIARGINAGRPRHQHISRNAAIGKATRMGFGGHVAQPRTTRPKLCRANKRKVVNGQAAKLAPLFNREPFVPSMEELVIPIAERKTVLTLTEKSCRWPIGDPQLEDFHFCGKEKVDGLPYCEFHARKAFQPPQVRSRIQAPVEPAAAEGAVKEMEEA